MVYLTLIIFFWSHLFLFQKIAFLPLKMSKMSKKWLFCNDKVVSRGKFYKRKKTFCVCFCWSKNIVLVPFAVRDVDSKALVFLFLNTVNWFWQKINAYGDLLQNKRHVWKHIPNLQNEKHVFEACFKFTKWKKFLKDISSLQNKKHVFKRFLFSCWKNQKHIFEVFSSLQHEKHTFLKRLSSLQNENTRFWSLFQYKKQKSTFWSVFQVYKMKTDVFEAFSRLQNRKARFWSVFYF